MDIESESNPEPEARSFGDICRWQWFCSPSHVTQELPQVSSSAGPCCPQGAAPKARCPWMWGNLLLQSLLLFCLSSNPQQGQPPGSTGSLKHGQSLFELKGTLSDWSVGRCHWLVYANNRRSGILLVRECVHSLGGLLFSALWNHKQSYGRVSSPVHVDGVPGWLSLWSIRL